MQVNDVVVVFRRQRRGGSCRGRGSRGCHGTLPACWTTSDPCRLGGGSPSRGDRPAWTEPTSRGWSDCARALQPLARQMTELVTTRAGRFRPSRKYGRVYIEEKQSINCTHAQLSVFMPRNACNRNSHSNLKLNQNRNYTSLGIGAYKNGRLNA